MADTSWQAWGIPLIVIGSLCRIPCRHTCGKCPPLSLPVLLALLLYLMRKWIRGPMYKGEGRMDGKTVVITGANTGIGKETAKDLAKRGARVVILCRNITKGKVAAEEVAGNDPGKVVVYPLDLSSLESVRECAKTLKEKESKIHVLINNAGVMMCPQDETKEGFELQLGTNHYGHFLLTLLLIENIKAAAPSRIVNVSSLAHVGGKMYWDDLNLTKNYSPHKAYFQSKLANILFTKTLATKLQGTGVTAYSLHPGTVRTELGRHIGSSYGSIFMRILDLQGKLFFKTPVLGAQTSIYCAVDEKIEKDSGYYYNDCARAYHTSSAKNEEDAAKLWNISLEKVGLENYQI